MKNPGKVSFYPLWIGIAVLIYWLGHVGLYKHGIVKERQEIRKHVQTANQKRNPSRPKSLIIERLKTYLVDDKQYLNPNLTLDQTARDLELSKGHLSKVINQELKVSFNDLCQWS